MTRLDEDTASKAAGRNRFVGSNPTISVTRLYLSRIRVPRYERGCRGFESLQAYKAAVGRQVSLKTTHNRL